MEPEENDCGIVFHNISFLIDGKRNTMEPVKIWLQDFISDGIFFKIWQSESIAICHNIPAGYYLRRYLS